MNNNKNLFFYGIKSNVIQFVGWGVGVLSFILFFVHWILWLLVMGIGIAIILYGKSMRFDYQRQSGSIIHRGDW